MYIGQRDGTPQNLARAKAGGAMDRRKTTRPSAQRARGMESFRSALILCMSLWIERAARGEPPVNHVSGAATISRPAGRSEIRITTTDRLAGAIDSLKWDGVEFIDSFDHGRQLQSAASFDCAREGEFWAEQFNPTEAGSRADGTGEHSSSKLLTFRAAATWLESTSQMAFWLAPGESSFGRPALNTTVLSNYRFKKRVSLGYESQDQVIDYQVTFTVPDEPRHRLAQFEALTAYMPADFHRFERFDPVSRRLVPLDPGPGEQPDPVVISDVSGSHALGVLALRHHNQGLRPSYGRFWFEQEQVAKWNCVFRVRDSEQIAPGEYAFRMLVVVGTNEDVQRIMSQWAEAEGASP
jgi:hypothetical protein